jgi:perosamine synthetase
MVKKIIPLMSPDIQDIDIDEVSKVLRSGMLVQGKIVEQLETKIAEYIGVKHAIAVSNGTASMHIALKLLNITSGDEVIIPALSYVATANVVELVGAKPVFVDIDLDTFNMSTKNIEKAITPRTKAIMPVHEFGLAADIEKIVELARKHDLYVIEDAACALGAKQHGVYTGKLGDMGSFSFHPRKAITSGEGGMITTDSDDFARKCRILRNHGVDASSGKMEFVEAGFNYRMTEFQAALVLSQFDRFEKTLNKRNELADVYFQELKNVDCLKLPQVPSGMFHTFQTFHVLLDRSINRSGLMDRLKENGIGVNYGAQCIPEQVYYLNKYKLDSRIAFPHSLNAYENGLALPLYEKLSAEDVRYVCNSLKDCLNG